MNLISCDHCGVVLDKDKLHFPTYIFHDDSSIDPKKGTWSDSKKAWVPFVSCPVCDEVIEGAGYYD